MYGVEDVILASPADSTLTTESASARTSYATEDTSRTPWRTASNLHCIASVRPADDSILEMVHAYDHLRFKVKWSDDLRHAACTEIRASSLSGECRFMREFLTRGQWKLTQQHQECVRRRATLSVRSRPGCKDDVHAARIVNEVWDSCFADTRPFDEIYR